MLIAPKMVKAIKAKSYNYKSCKMHLASICTLRVHSSYISAIRDSIARNSWLSALTISEVVLVVSDWHQLLTLQRIMHPYISDILFRALPQLLGPIHNHMTLYNFIGIHGTDIHNLFKRTWSTTCNRRRFYSGLWMRPSAGAPPRTPRGITALLRLPGYISGSLRGRERKRKDGNRYGN